MTSQYLYDEDDNNDVVMQFKSVLIGLRSKTVYKKWIHPSEAER